VHLPTLLCGCDMPVGRTVQNSPLPLPLLGNGVGWDVELQAGRAQNPFPKSSFSVSNLPNPSSRNMALGVHSALDRISTRSKTIIFLVTEARPLRKAANETPSVILESQILICLRCLLHG
jgi:hypothetical protein